MAIPLWRQYTRLSREDRDAILERRRGRLDESSTLEEILEAFQQDAREVRDAYRGRGVPGDGDSVAATAEAVDNSPFARRQRAFEGLNERDRSMADAIATRTSIPIEDIAGELDNYRSQVNLPGRSPAEIDRLIVDSLARNFPK